MDGIDGARFLETVRAYNDAVMTEVPFDPTMKDGRGTRGIAPKKSNWANRIDTPPFEAYAVTCGITFTFGGLAIDPKARVQAVSGRADPRPLCGGRAGGRALLRQLSRRHGPGLGRGLRPPRRHRRRPLRNGGPRPVSREHIGFIGVGVMGEPMCRNLVRKHDGPVTAYDIDPAPLERLAENGAVVAPNIAALAEAADLVFLSLPSGREVRSVCLGDGGLIEHLPAGRTVVDTSTAPPALAREIEGAFAALGVAFADAPVARTRQAAIEGTLSIMVGGDAALVERLRPLLGHIAQDVTHCGPVGSGQAVKILNNMILFQNVRALAESLAIARRQGIDACDLPGGGGAQLGRQLCAPKSRHEGDAGGPLPGRRVPRHLRDERPRLRP